MATEKLVLTESWPAGEDLTECQYHAVYLDGGELKKATTKATHRLLGILQDAPNTGQAGWVAMLGISKAVVSGDTGDTVEYGDPLTVHSDGTLIKATYEEMIVGHALEGTSADDNIIRVFLTPLVQKFEEDTT